MTDFTNFMLQSTYPPNPIRALDNSLTASQQAGRDFFFNQAPDGTELPSDRVHNCNGCHTLDRNGNQGLSAHPGFFGTSGRLSFENESQLFKVPHLRNLYQKLGMYGSSPDTVHAIGSLVPALNPTVSGVRGFGFQHDGADGKLEDFFTAFVFVQATTTVDFQGASVGPNPFGIPLFADSADPLNASKGLSTEGLELRNNIVDFMMALDSNLLPIVGQQITTTTLSESASLRVSLLEERALNGEADLVAHVNVRGDEHGFVFYQGAWVPDVSWIDPLSDEGLFDWLHHAPLTIMAVPPGEGWRVGVDRDGDGYANGDELALGADPRDPSSHP